MVLNTTVKRRCRDTVGIHLLSMLHANVDVLDVTDVECPVDARGH
jgi:hypothetical protein